MNSTRLGHLLVYCTRIRYTLLNNRHWCRTVVAILLSAAWM
jgi:hypothetical protein